VTKLLNGVTAAFRRQPQEMEYGLESTLTWLKRALKYVWLVNDLRYMLVIKRVRKNDHYAF